MTEDDPTGAYSKKGQAIAIGEDICKNYARMGNDVVILASIICMGKYERKRIQIRSVRICASKQSRPERSLRRRMKK